MNKVEILKIEKLAQVFEGVGPKTVRSIVAIKDGVNPRIHLMAVPHELADKMDIAMKLIDVQMSYVEVVHDDFGEVQLAQVN